MKMHPHRITGSGIIGKGETKWSLSRVDVAFLMEVGHWSETSGLQKPQPGLVSLFLLLLPADPDIQLSSH